MEYKHLGVARWYEAWATAGRSSRMKASGQEYAFSVPLNRV